MKSRRTRGTREETRKRRAGEWLSDCRELLLNKKNSRSLLSNFRRRRKLCPSRLRRSLARSLAVRFTRPNRRACSQAKYEPLVVSIEPEGTRTFQNREYATGKRLLHEATLRDLFILVAWDWVCVVSNCTMGLLGRCNFFYWLRRKVSQTSFLKTVQLNKTRPSHKGNLNMAS